jgi:diguanylate cyclase (GGDEF)-like protein
MAAPRLRLQLAVAAVAVTAVLLADSSGLLGPQAAVVLDDSAQLGAGLLAAVCCAVTARRTSGVERAWRRLMAIGLVGWSIGQVIWSYYQVFAQRPLPSPSWADVGYLTLPVFALAALLTLAANGVTAHRRQVPAGGSALRSRLVLTLDGLVIVGSLLIFTWATSLGTVVRAGAPTGLGFAVAIAYPITDLMLVVIVVLLLATRPVQARMRTQLVLLGLGLVGFSFSDSIFAYLVASGANSMPPISNVGFIAGPVLVALAALNYARPGAGTVVGRQGAAVEWFHLLMPYLCMLVTSVLVVAQNLAGLRVDAFEAYTGVAIFWLVVIRQMITLIDNTVLLARVSDAQDRLAYQAFHDPLTGLANRALFRSRLADAVELNRSERRPVALLFVDLDDFKLVNDSLGHAGGDRVLQAVGERLRSCVPSADIVARLGGDEFGVLMEGEIDHPDQVGERILAALRRPFDVDGRGVSIGASLGAVIPDGTEPALTADALLRRADAAMYAGKRRGKGLLVLYGPESADGYDNPDLPTLLAGALAGEPERTGLDVHYQPIVRMADGGTVAVEALARWNHPLMGQVPPSVFVAIAERAGLVAALDDFVLDRACRDLASYLGVNGGDAVVHVNVSASRLGNPDLERVVRDALRRYGLTAQHLVLEVTESSRIPDPVAAVASAERLRATGIRLALDDFGTGYNTLAQLHLLPIDILKLDRTLTTVDQDPVRVAALCGSVVRIAADLGITVVAEGIETADQAAALARLGCGFGQGHLYGRPAPFTDVTPAGAAFTSAQPVRRHLRESQTPAG